MNVPEGHRLVNVIYIRTTPGMLWYALTRPEYSRQYYHGMDLVAELQPGGRFEYHYRPEIHQREGVGQGGRVLDVVPREKLMHTFEPRVIPDRPSRVCYQIDRLDSVCRLTVTHDDFPEGSLTLHTAREGWPAVLCSLKSLLETGEPLVFPR